MKCQYRLLTIPRANIAEKTYISRGRKREREIEWNIRQSTIKHPKQKKSTKNLKVLNKVKKSKQTTRSDSGTQYTHTHTCHTHIFFFFYIHLKEKKNNWKFPSFDLKNAVDFDILTFMLDRNGIRKFVSYSLVSLKNWKKYRKKRMQIELHCSVLQTIAFINGYIISTLVSVMNHQCERFCLALVWIINMVDIPAYESYAMMKKSGCLSMKTYGIRMEIRQEMRRFFLAL